MKQSRAKGHIAIKKEMNAVNVHLLSVSLRNDY